jgi:small subunit ribosomal protein S17
MAGEAKSVIKKTRTGVVVSDKMAKTIVVTVESTKSHPLYKKILKRSRKFMVHDEKNEAKVGDVVRFVEVRPLSKNKCWKLLKILEKAK